MCAQRKCLFLTIKQDIESLLHRRFLFSAVIKLPHFRTVRKHPSFLFHPYVHRKMLVVFLEFPIIDSEVIKKFRDLSCAPSLFANVVIPRFVTFLIKIFC
jgi:hypothetical protein